MHIDECFFGRAIAKHFPGQHWCAHVGLGNRLLFFHLSIIENLCHLWDFPSCLMVKTPCSSEGRAWVQSLVGKLVSHAAQQALITCLQSHVIRACWAAWFLPAHLHDNCHLSWVSHKNEEYPTIYDNTDRPWRHFVKWDKIRQRKRKRKKEKKNEDSQNSWVRV